MRERIVVMDDVRALQAIEGDWSDLCDRSRTATPFQRPAWILAWCKHFPRSIRAVAMRREDRLVGLAPLFVWEREGRRVVSFLGAGISDRLDAVFEEGFEDEGAAKTLAHAASELGDAWELDALTRGSALGECPAPRAWREARVPQDPCPRIVFPHGARALEECVSVAQAARYRRDRRRAERSGALRLARAGHGDGRWNDLLAALFDLHAARWASREQPGVLADACVRAFHIDAAAGFAARGALRLYALHLDDA